MVYEQLWKKSFFSPRGPWWTHHWPPLCVGWPALRLHQVTTGTGVYVSRSAILRMHENPETKNGPYLGLRGSKTNSEGT